MKEISINPGVIQKTLLIVLLFLMVPATDFFTQVTGSHLIFLFILIAATFRSFYPQLIASRKPLAVLFGLFPFIWIFAIMNMETTKGIIQIANSSSDTVLEDVVVMFTEGKPIDFGDIKPNSTRIKRSPVGEGKQYKILFTYNGERRITEKIKTNSKKAVSPLRSQWSVYQDADESK